MEFTNKFHVPLPIDQAWALLLDVPRIMPCLPGAKLTEVVGPGKYKGSVTVKLGPVSLTFNGLVELVKQDDAAHVAWLKGSGVDPKGRGGAQSEFSFALTEVQGGSDVVVATNLTLSGSVAQYGRGSGMISDVAAQILKQFEKNLAKSFAPVEPAATAPAAAPASAPSPAVDTLPPEGSAPAGAIPPVAPAPSAPPKPAPQVYSDPAPELNMLSIGMKAMWRSFLRMLGIGKA
jgi:carbon monoxide dehydrogenase subunit G